MVSACTARDKSPSLLHCDLWLEITQHRTGHNTGAGQGEKWAVPRESLTWQRGGWQVVGTDGPLGVTGGTHCTQKETQSAKVDA